MSKVYVISDLHLGHKKLAALRGYPSPDEHDSALVEAWNSVVGKRDVVYVLGDVMDPALLMLMRGTKKLAMGNHDTKPTSLYLTHCSQVRAYYVYDGCLLSHIPVHPSQKARWRMNVHGHSHARPLDDPWYLCVCIELIGMAPRLLNELITERAARLTDRGASSSPSSPGRASGVPGGL